MEKRICHICKNIVLITSEGEKKPEGLLTQYRDGKYYCDNRCLRKDPKGYIR